MFGILANRWRIFFTTISLEPKHVENIVLSALALHNILIKNPAYRPCNLADALLEDGEVLEGDCVIMLPPIHSIRFRFQEVGQSIHYG